MDVSKKYLKDTEAAYILNVDNRNPKYLGKGTPFGANLPLCDMELPAGNSFNNGRYYSPITNETYFWTYNSNGINFIGRVNGDGVCEVVYHNNDDRCLQLSPEPENEITQWRAYMHVEKSNCANRHGKYLVWTNGLANIGWLDVEASIATNNFSTPFFDDCVSGCEPLELCVPQPCSVITAEYIPLPASEISLTNEVADKGFKFIYRWLYYDNLRASEWSDVSSAYYEISESCFYNSGGESSCIKLRVPAGNPLVDKIEIAFTKGDKSTDGSAIWYQAEIVEKYKIYNSSNQYWYEREISEEILNYSDCAFDYIFCNNKQCQAVDITEVDRVYNPIPLRPQGIIPVDNGFGFYNYEQGNCQIDKTEIAKFEIKTVCPTGTDCQPEMRTLKVRAIIQSSLSNFSQFLWRKGGAVGDLDDTTDTVLFGGFENSQINAGHNQNFTGNTRGFRVYVEGTEFFAEMVQMQSDAGFVGANPAGILSGQTVDNTGFLAAVNNVRDDGGYYFQEATILIPKGMSGTLRLDSHLSPGLDENTSTQVIGTIDDITAYVVDEAPSGFNQFQFEIPFGCDDTDLLTAFVIDDTTLSDHDGNHSSVSTSGYIKDNIGRPLEGLEIWATREATGGGDDTNHVFARTDHNGYYFLYNWVGKIKNSTAGIYGETDCSTWNKIQPIVLNRTGYGRRVIANSTISESSYMNDFYAKVSVTVKDCFSNPIPGLKVALSGSKAQVTNSAGVAQWSIRNYKSRDRIITATFMSKYNCYTVDCNGGCNPCAPSKQIATIPCYATVPVFNFGVFTVSLQSALQHSQGLKSGGLYPMGFVLKGDCGYITAVNELPQLSIEKTQSKGKFGYCSFAFDATGISLPLEANCLHIVRGVNLNNYELQWLVDKVEKTTDNKIKLTIQSLNDYNEKYFFKTNTNYQYLAGDRIEFISNGDGKVIDTNTYGLLNYAVLSPFLDMQIVNPSANITTDYFNQLLIDDDGKLDFIVPGAKIEIQRSKECTTDPVYFGIGAIIPIVNGKLVSETGNFTMFDTYSVERQVGKFSVQAFESKIPSDFWLGTVFDDTGKSYFINKFENKKRFGRNISLSLPGQLNFFGSIIKTFDAPEQGDITSMNILDAKIILAIGENDSFLAQVSNDLVRVGGDGLIRAATPDQVFSDAEPKIRGQYGCQYEDIGSIVYYDGGATWVDSDRMAHVVHNYSFAKDISEGFMQSYFRRKLADQKVVNSSAVGADKMRWISGENKLNGTIMLTLKSLTQSSTNNDLAPYLQLNSTIIFSPDEKEPYLTFFSTTPEGYAALNLNDKLGCCFVAFINSIPYLHPANPEKWNEFFGIPVDMVVVPSFNDNPKKLKNYIATELQDSAMWFVKYVETNEPDFVSEIPPARFKKLKDKWNASFLSNSNSRDGLYGSKTPSGYYCAPTFVRDNTDGLKYNTIDNAKRILFSELDIITAKFNFIESSGMTENL